MGIHKKKKQYATYCYNVNKIIRDSNIFDNAKVSDTWYTSVKSNMS